MSLRETPQPLVAFHADLNNVMRLNRRPFLDTASTLDILQLSGSVPDGKSLGGRLLNSQNCLDKVLPPTGDSMRLIKESLVFTNQLLGQMARHIETDPQHAEAETLVAVAEKQIVRENNICPIATDLYLSAGAARPEMVNRSVYEQLAFQAAFGQMMELALRAMKSGTRVEIVDLRKRRRE